MSRGAPPAGPRCPICDAAAAPRAANPAFPFCSPRCKTIDLGKWLNEEYRVPVPPGDEDEDGEAAAGADVTREGGAPRTVH